MQPGDKPIIAMIHVPALPGTPRSTQSMSAILLHCINEANMYADLGVDALLIENMHDVPYLRGRVGPEITAAMTAVTTAVKQAAPQLPLGVQILAAANHEALAAALAGGADFIRVENFAYAHVADEGLMPEAEAGTLLRFRKAIAAEHIKIHADVKKKHSSHAITADVSLSEAATTTAFFGADGMIVTGSATGEPTRPDDVSTVKAAISKATNSKAADSKAQAEIPVWIGSGTTPENLPALWPHADGFIIGSYFKQDGLWSNPIDPERVRKLLDKAKECRMINYE
jgi:membrane complex biogenesis BtpA family protein